MKKTRSAKPADESMTLSPGRKQEVFTIAQVEEVTNADQPLQLPDPDAPGVIAGTVELFWESAVAKSLGLERERISKIRREHLTVGDDYHTVRGDVVLTARGLSRLNDFVAAEGQRVDAADVRVVVTGSADTGILTMQAGPPAREKFTVSKVPRNKHLLYCTKASEKGSGRMVLVRVKDNAMFMPRMVLEAIEAEHGAWQFRGRLPRRKGRWK